MYQSSIKWKIHEGHAFDSLHSSQHLCNSMFLSSYFKSEVGLGCNFLHTSTTALLEGFGYRWKIHMQYKHNKME